MAGKLPSKSFGCLMAFQFCQNHNCDERDRDPGQKHGGKTQPRNNDAIKQRTYAVSEVGAEIHDAAYRCGTSSGIKPNRKNGKH